MFFRTTGSGPNTLRVLFRTINNTYKVITKFMFLNFKFVLKSNVSIFCLNLGDSFRKNLLSRVEKFLSDQ